MFLKNNFIKNYIYFFPKFFIFSKEQRLKYWIKYLSFFIYNAANKKSSFYCDNTLSNLNFVFNHLNKNKIFEYQPNSFNNNNYFFEDINSKNTFFFYFNLKKYFFSFLLLKLFFQYSRLKKIIFKKNDYKLKKKFKFKKYKFFINNTDFNSKNIGNFFNNNIKHTSFKNEKAPFSLFKNFNLRNLVKKFSLIDYKVLFLVTNKIQKRFIDNVFNWNKNFFLCLEKDLITNKYFFYSNVFGFSKEKKHVISIKSFFLKCSLRIKIQKKLKFLNFKYTSFFWLLDFFSFYSNFFYKIFNFLLLKILFFLKILKFFVFLNFKFFLNFASFNFFRNFSKFYFYILDLYFFGFLISISNIYFLKYFCLNFLKKINNSKSINLNFIKKVYLENFKSLYKLLKFYFIFFNMYKNNLIPKVSSLFLKKFQYDNKIIQRKKILNSVVLLNFLPINLVVLFSSVINKQAIFDAFKIKAPLILISSMENPIRFSDYNFPGNGSKISVLYFYVRFFLSFLKN